MKNNSAQGHMALPKSLTQSQFQKLLQAGLITDGRMGGLVMGRGYDTGGVGVVFKLGCDYVIDTRTEGGEFIMNAEASAFNYNRLAAIKSGILPAEEGNGPVENIHLLMTEAQPDDKLLWLDWGATAIPCPIAEKHLSELFRLNREWNPYLKCDLIEAFCLK